MRRTIIALGIGLVLPLAAAAQNLEDCEVEQVTLREVRLVCPLAATSPRSDTERLRAGRPETVSRVEEDHPRMRVYRGGRETRDAWIGAGNTLSVVRAGQVQRLRIVPRED